MLAFMKMTTAFYATKCDTSDPDFGGAPLLERPTVPVRLRRNLVQSNLALGDPVRCASLSDSKVPDSQPGFVCYPMEADADPDAAANPGDGPRLL
jgi:hypothetical protein